MVADAPPGNMTGTDYEVAVIGAGPAGALAAFTAARAGRKVLLIDKARFPRAKVCGCCLSGAAVAALEAAGLQSVLREAAPLRRFALTAGGRTATLPLHDSRALSRAALDAELVSRACDAGAHFHAATIATLGELRPHGRVLHLQAATDRSAQAIPRPAAISVEAVIVADGLGGRTLNRTPGFEPRVAERSRLGLAATLEAPHLCEPEQIRMACATSGYAGFVRLEDGRTNVAAAIAPAALQQSATPADAVRQIFNDARLPTDTAALAAARFRGTPHLTRRRPNRAGDRLLVIGDAAAYVEPFTGEGIAWALATGAAAGRLLSDALARSERAATLDYHHLRRWERQWQNLVATPQRRCRLIAALLRRPTVLTVGVRLLGRLPWMGSLVTRELAEPLRGATA